MTRVALVALMLAAPVPHAAPAAEAPLLAARVVHVAS